jgi:CRP-like cAMP-binding protein
MDAVVTTLRTVSLFAELPREVLARLVSEFDELETPAGRTVFSQGDPGDALYVVVSGAVEVRGERGGQGERVAVLGPGDCLGVRGRRPGGVPAEPAVLARTRAGRGLTAPQPDRPSSSRTWNA